MTDKIPNPYKAAIRNAKQSAAGPAADLRDALKDVKAAMDGNCWMSTTADTFYGELVGNHGKLGRCHDDAMAEFQDAIDAQPDEIERDDWRARWAKFAQMVR